MNRMRKVQNLYVGLCFKEAIRALTNPKFVSATCLVFSFSLALSNSKAMAMAASDDLFRTYEAINVKGLDFDHREGGGSAESCDTGSCTADFITVGQLNDRQWGPYAGINDFGKVAKKWSFLRNNRPPHYDCSIGLDFSVTNWVTTSRCIDQMGSDKYEEILRNALSVSGGQEYKQDVLNQQLAAEVPHLGNIIRNFVKSRGAETPLVFEIGNEPNVFPAMNAAMYAAYYIRWVDEIRKATAEVSSQLNQQLNVKVMPAGLWIMEGQPTYLRSTFDQGVAFAFGRITIRVPKSVDWCGASVWPPSPGYPCVKFGNLDITPGVDVKSRIYADTAAYLRDFLAAVPPGYIDYGNLHFYPYIGPEAAFGEGQMDPHLANLNSLVKTYASRANTGEVWLTEIGNFNPLNQDETIQKLMKPMLSSLKARSIPEISRVYWFKGQGEDKKFDVLPESANSIWFTGALVAGNDLIQGLDALLGPLFTIVRPVTDSATVAKIATYLKRFSANHPFQGLKDDAGVPRAMGTVYYNYAMTPKPGEPSDGNGDWAGCRGNGLYVCTELVGSYPNYFRNHPSCIANSTCDGSFYTCNSACSEPDDLDR